MMEGHGRTVSYSTASIASFSREQLEQNVQLFHFHVSQQMLLQGNNVAGSKDKTKIIQ